MIHSMDDEACPVSSSQALASLWPGAELVLVDGLGHRLVAQDDAVLARALEFVEDVRLAAPAHGCRTIEVRKSVIIPVVN